MMKKMIFFIAMMIFVTGCQSTKNTSPFEETVLINCPLKPFNAIVVSKNNTVELINGDYSMDIMGVSKNDCSNNIINQVLYIDNVSNKTSNAIIKVSTNKLKKITVIDNATVNAQNFKTDNLTLVAEDDGSINLTGYFNINKISQFSNNRINISWIDSNSLIIESYGDGPIHLAGKVKNMAVKLMSEAKLYARYLRAQKAYVFTTDSAIAEILALDTLGAFATDKSNIFYYKNPKNKTIVTKDSSNVLYPRWTR